MKKPIIPATLLAAGLALTGCLEQTRDISPKPGSNASVEPEATEEAADSGADSGAGRR